MTTEVESRPRIVLVQRALIQEGERILLLQRAATDSWEPGFWELPGGKFDAGQTMQDALEREIFEETGVVIAHIGQLLYYESYEAKLEKYAGLPYLCLYFVVQKIAGNTTLSDEHDNFAWVTAEEALQKELSTGTHKALLMYQEHQQKNL